MGDNVRRPVHYDPRNVSVIIEGLDVISLSTFSDSDVVLFGLIYVLHLDYPEDLKFTFQFFQKVLLGLDGSFLKGRLLSFKDDLLRNPELVVRTNFRNLPQASLHMKVMEVHSVTYTT